MRWFLGILAVLIFLCGIMEFLTASNVLQQICASIILCWSAILFVGAAIVDAVVELKKYFQVREDVVIAKKAGEK